jgi:hypothetical protein
MDERHEELKGARGWSSPYRRSVSWLAYLSEPGWRASNEGSTGASTGAGAGAGGQFRAFVRENVIASASARCGAHEGNLQIGWRALSASEARRRPAAASAASGASGGVLDGHGAEPVYLDAWVPVEVALSGQRGRSAQYTSLAACYRVIDGQRQYLSGGVEGGGAQTIDELISTMKGDERRRFSRVEVSQALSAPPSGACEECVTPVGGTLLLFDSVAVPHEVLETVAGERWAMAGWFHEPSQGVPSWLG